MKTLLSTEVVEMDHDELGNTCGGVIRVPLPLGPYFLPYLSFQLAEAISGLFE